MENDKTIKMLEAALTENSETLTYLLSILNNTETINKRLIQVGVSVPFLTINHTCGRPDRNATHLKEAWATHFKEKPEETKTPLSYDEFCLSMRYELTSNMGLDELGHYHGQLGLCEDTEIDVVYKALLIYEDDRVIMQHHDDSFELIIGNQIYTAESYTSADFTDLQCALHDYYKSEAS